MVDDVGSEFFLIKWAKVLSPIVLKHNFTREPTLGNILVDIRGKLFLS